MNLADELLKRVLDAWTDMSGPFDYTRIPQVMAEIEVYLDETEKQKANRANDWLLMGSEPACTACLSTDIIHQFAGAHMDKANELLLKALGILDMESFELSLQEEIRAYLATPITEQEPPSLNEVVKAFNDSPACGELDNFIAGFLFAKKHYGFDDE